MSETFTTYGVGSNRPTYEQLRDECARYKAALESITEYWNGHDNERSLVDACRQNRDVARAALNYTEQEAQSEDERKMTRGLQRNETEGCIAELDRLASEGREGG